MTWHEVGPLQIVFLGNSDAGYEPHGQVNLDVLRGIPALILDHEQEHILYDPEARQAYARKVGRLQGLYRVVIGKQPWFSHAGKRLFALRKPAEQLQAAA